MDGCASHYSKKIVATAERHGILLVCLPANGHLPLDVTVFSSFKAKLNLLVQELSRDNGEVNASKATAVRLASLEWEAFNIGKNITSGFKSCGIYPLSLVRMQNKLANFQRDSTPSEVQRAKCLRVKHVVQEDVLVLSAPVRKRTQHKTVTVAGRLLTRKLLDEITSAQETTKQPEPRDQSGPGRKRQHRPLRHQQLHSLLGYPYDCLLRFQPHCLLRCSTNMSSWCEWNG
jgi:hypothetical protein